MEALRLSVNPQGEWSPAQARRVLDVINPEAAARGLRFHPVDVTNISHKAPRVLLVAYCAEHEIAVAHGSVCSECMRLCKPLRSPLT